MKRIIATLLILLTLFAGAAAAESEVPIQYADATSWIVGKDPNAYAPQKMLDGIETTSFQFSTLTTPLGKEYVYFYFYGPSEIDSLWIKNGFWKITNGLDQYTRNCRVKSMTVEFRYSYSGVYTDGMTVTLADDPYRYNWTKVSLGNHTDVVSVRFLIQSIYYGTKFPNDVCISEVRFMSGSQGSSSGALYGLATMKLATRSGPGTQYSEQGTYFVAGQYIRVLSRAWDSRNEIWWVKCEIPYGNGVRILWTGYKRFDSSTLPLSSIPIE